MSIKTWWNGMTVTERINAIFRGITTIGTIGGAVACVHEVRKSKKTLDYATAKIGNGVDVEVSEQMVQDAVERAVQVQAYRAVRKVTDQIEHDIEQETKELVEGSVRDVQKTITDKVSSRIEEECRKINGNEIIKDIKDQASEKLAEKLDEKLDDITEEYAKNLDSMGKVYEALATKLQSKA